MLVDFSMVWLVKVSTTLSWKRSPCESLSAKEQDGKEYVADLVPGDERGREHAVDYDGIPKEAVGCDGGVRNDEARCGPDGSKRAGDESKGDEEAESLQTHGAEGAMERLCGGRGGWRRLGTQGELELGRQASPRRPLSTRTSERSFGRTWPECMTSVFSSSQPRW